MSAEDEAQQKLSQDDDVDGDHEWHYRYNRRLQCFSHAVTSLIFSLDGQYLVSATSSGDVKIWDTGSWAEAAKLRGCLRKEPRALVISPAQRWLVSAYPSVLQIFQCSPPWRMEQALPAVLDPATKEPQEWMCIAFSPMAEVDHPGGKTGQDNHLAAFSSAALCVLDYSNGWGTDTPRRTRSLMQSSKPTSLAYTSCGWWIICGFESGQLQIWNAFSLTLEKTVNGHSDCVNCLASSPRAASYESRFVSCGVDQTLRVWHSSGWILEQHVHDTRCDRNGVRKVSFSAGGNWLVSVASELSVWRVCITRRGHLVLCLHQRLAAICGAEGLRAAAFCCNGDALAVGSRDGVLGLWTKYPGSPPDPVDPATSTAVETGGSRSTPWTGTTMALPRPMQRLTPQGLRPLGKPPGQRGEWFQRQHLRTVSMTSLGSRAPLGNSPAHAGGRLALTPDRSAPSSGHESPVGGPAVVRGGLTRTSTTPDFSRWRASQTFDFEDVLSHIDGNVAGASKRLSNSLPAAEPASECVVSPMRKSMLQACSRGPVKRISLDPKIITEHSK